MNPLLDLHVARYDLKSELAQQQALHAVGPWPKYLQTYQGGLPEICLSFRAPECIKMGAESRRA